jgi:predicted nucleotidyltransferase
MTGMVAKSHANNARELYYRYLPPNIPMSAIRRVARRMAAELQPDKVILFGSFAYGTPHEWSDVDLLVVMDTHNEISQATRIKLTLDGEFPIDVIVRTPTRFRFWLAEGDSFLKEIVSKGIVLYEKDNQRMDKKSRKRHTRRSK